ncbi:hypothetical protein [Alloacidobacterium sp.]|uniref:hypothetical protein n=1 Tax=Alloacidobacterium sp. TaxID=2951999 RepID=UPI002D4EFCF8|nr:hypothetical protein [Alloacidobacterium sp.]HYK37416.1 hypothetical protein [Alloacidobacterium sp.]
MRRFPGILIALFSLFAPSVSHALSSDTRLLSLVSPSALIVAGMDSPPPKELPGSFVLMTHSNRMDLNDVLALIGADSTLSIHHAVFVAKNDIGGYLNEHSLLMSGHFDQARIYKSAVESGARLIQYRGLPILVIQPFARERGEMDDVRWLAVLGSDVLLFGWIPSVREELDRYLAHDAPDSVFAGKLAHLRRDDETWTMVWTPTRNPEIEGVLTALDPRLGELAEHADAFLFGIRYHRQVEFEYEALKASGTAEGAIPESAMQSFVDMRKGSALLPRQNPTDNSIMAHGMVKIPVAEFSKWLEKVSTD